MITPFTMSNGLKVIMKNFYEGFLQHIKPHIPKTWHQATSFISEIGMISHGQSINIFYNGLRSKLFTPEVMRDHWDGGVQELYNKYFQLLHGYNENFVDSAEVFLSELAHLYLRDHISSFRSAMRIFPTARSLEGLVVPPYDGRLKKDKIFDYLYNKKCFSGELSTKIVENIRYIDSYHFNTALESMVRGIRDFVNSDPYFLCFTTWKDRDKSGPFIYKTIKDTIPPAQNAIGFVSGGSKIMNFISRDKLSEDSKVVVIDDWAVSGAQTSLLIYSMCNLYGVKRENILIALLGITQPAIERFEEEQIANLSSYFLIPTVFEIFNTEDIMKIIPRNSHETWSLISKILTYHCFRIPDNFLVSFPPQLLPTEGSYRNGSVLTPR